MKQSKIERNISLYVAAWNVEDLDSIKFAITAFWTEESTYVDANTREIKGIDALADLIQKSHHALPGRRFSQLTNPDTFNDTGRYTWMLHNTDETTHAGRIFLNLTATDLLPV